MLGRKVVEGDAKERIVVRPPGRTEDRGMQCGLAPGDSSAPLEDPTGGQLDREQNMRSGSEPQRGASAESADSDIRAT